MAWRIQNSVVRGEIENRVKGIVRGQIWIEGRAEPVVLELKGNARPDLAGCLLTFTNPQRPSPDPRLVSLHPVQCGTIGNLTASRKVRVFDAPLAQALAMIRRQEEPRSIWSILFIWSGSAKPTAVSSSKPQIMS